MLDVHVENHGSIALIRCLTQTATDWVVENIRPESWQWMGNGVACEPRYTQDIIDKMQADGLTVRV